MANAIFMALPLHGLRFIAAKHRYRTVYPNNASNASDVPYFCNYYYAATVQGDKFIKQFLRFRWPLQEAFWEATYKFFPSFIIAKNA